MNQKLEQPSQHDKQYHEEALLETLFLGGHT